MRSAHARLPLLLPLFCIMLLSHASCSTSPKRINELVRRGDEIVIAGRFFHTGAPVVLWIDPGGYDAYRVERRFARPEESTWEASHAAGIASPNRYGPRKFGNPPSPSPGAGRRDGDWTLEELQQHLHQLILHYDAAGTSQACFRVLHDVRGLSCHFLIDLDGTIYQTLDVKERAWHAAHANDRSIGVELANIGAYPAAQADAVLGRWYEPGPRGVRIRAEKAIGQRRAHESGYIDPARADRVVGTINGQMLVQHDFTRAQYESLAALAATLHHVLPRLALDIPRDAQGQVIMGVLHDEQQRSFCGVMGHFHLTEEKVDPGPAFAWESWLALSKRRYGALHK